MRISDWSSDVCSSDLVHRYLFRSDLPVVLYREAPARARLGGATDPRGGSTLACVSTQPCHAAGRHGSASLSDGEIRQCCRSRTALRAYPRSEEHTSELQSLMRISSAVFCLQKKTYNKRQ